MANYEKKSASQCDRRIIKPDADGVVIGPSSSSLLNGGAAMTMPAATTRGSISAIRAKLKPLTNQERIEQSEILIQDVAKQQKDFTKRLNSKKSFSNRVVKSFKVDATEVKNNIQEHTDTPNLPSNTYAKKDNRDSVVKKKKGTMKKKLSKSKLNESSELIGWQHTSKEVEKNSDLETILIEA